MSWQIHSWNLQSPHFQSVSCLQGSHISRLGQVEEDTTTNPDWKAMTTLAPKIRFFKEHIQLEPESDPEVPMPCYMINYLIWNCALQRVHWQNNTVQDFNKAGLFGTMPVLCWLSIQVLTSSFASFSLDTAYCLTALSENCEDSNSKASATSMGFHLSRSSIAYHQNKQTKF